MEKEYTTEKGSQAWGLEATYASAESAARDWPGEPILVRDVTPWRPLRDDEP